MGMKKELVPFAFSGNRIVAPIVRPIVYAITKLYDTMDWNSSPSSLLPRNFSLTRAYPGTYYDSAGLLQTAAIDVTRGTYRYNGSAWVFDGTIVESAATNSLLRSRALGTAPWVGSGTAGVQNATGIDGSANTAWTLTDANAGTFDGYYSSGAITITANTSPTAFSVRVLKDSNNTTFPALRVDVGGTTLVTDVVFNTSTGAFTAQNILGTGGGNVEDEGLWWKVTCYVNNNGALTSAFCTLFPAYTTGTTASAASVAAQRSCVVDQFDHRPNSTVTDSPIITDGVAVPRAADVLTGATSGKLVNAQGFAAIGFRAIDNGLSAGAGSFISTFAGSEGMPLNLFSGAINFYDGAAFRAGNALASLTPGTTYKMGSTWGGSSGMTALNGTSSASLTFDGSMNFGATIRIGDNVAAVFQPISMVLQSLRLGTYSLSPGELELQTS
jgi:hypothetical protein